MMVKKTAILTLYYHNYNYGGLLQAYALQKAVIKSGHQAKQISYRLESGYDGWNPVKASIKKPVAYLYHWAKYGKWFDQYTVRRKKFEAFAETIPHTEVVTAQNISKLGDQFDYFVCGSDQIWNPIGWQPTLFFDFLPDDKKRISYAASIARDSLTEEEYDFMKPYLDEFSAISVREKNSADMLNRKFPQLNVQAVPDPVFLLEEEEWRTLIPKVNERKVPYIFAYFLGENDENRQKAIQYAEDRKLKIRFVSYLDYAQSGWDKKHPELLAPPMGVDEFLQDIANAELVLTDSFHAAAFSSILQTPFYALSRFKARDRNSMNSRILNLVQELEIPKRYTETLPVDYQWQEDEQKHINENLNRMQKNGIQFLKESLG